MRAVARPLALALAVLAAPLPAGASQLGNAFAPALAGARTSAGMAGLVEHPALSAAAQAYAERMAATGHFGHVGPDGSTHIARAQASGCHSRYVGENIAWGQSSAAEAFAGWMASQPHRINVLNPYYRQFGIGAADGRWVMLFADGC